MAELPHLGKQCSLCSIDDFLPITCVHCNKVFCKDHHISHGCVPEVQPEVTDQKESSGNNSIKCNFCSDSVPIIQSSICLHCQQRLCLPHRHQVDHKCPNLNNTDKAQGNNTNTEKILSKIRSVYNPGIVLKNRGSKNTPLALKVAKMKLKSKWADVGPDGISMEETEYFYLSFVPSEDCYNQESKAFQNEPLFLYKEWSIGKCIDWIAQKRFLVNRNNQLDKPRLILITAESLIEESSSKRFCCKKQNHYLCFEHSVKELINENVLSPADYLIITYQIFK